MTTPRDALATALRLVQPPDPVWVEGIADPPSVPTANWPGWADRMLFVLEAEGWTVARTEHARDGEALARLRESIPDGWSWGVFWASEMFRDGAAHPGQVSAWTEDPSDADRWTNLTKFGDTIAAAADACREAIEASR